MYDWSYFLVILNKIWCCVNLVNSRCLWWNPGVAAPILCSRPFKAWAWGAVQYIDQHRPCTGAVWAFFCAKVGAKHDILQNLFTYFLLINFVSVCPWIRKTKCTDQPALNFLRELFGQRICFLKWKSVMFNLCNGTFRIEGSGGLRKPLQLGCDCQLKTGPRSAVGKVSGYRCVSDCNFRRRKFDPGPVPYFRGDWSWNNFYGHSPPFRWFIQEGLLSVTSESMYTNYWLTACSSLPRKKCG